MHYNYGQDNQGYWRWNLRAANNEIIANGEAYHNEADCLHAIALVKSSKDAPVYKVSFKK
jgi:uncharacterized protein